MTTAAIPCKRPKVVVGPRETDSSTGHVAVCRVPRCAWSYPQRPDRVAVKTDAEQQATWHRRDHRAAVPKTKILGNGFEGFRGQCGYSGLTVGCGGELVIEDIESYAGCRQALDAHLVDAHGLVTC